MPYGPEFAQFYDRHWRSFGETVAPRILAHVESLVTGRRVLDLCCGTGASSQAFAEAGWSVFGVDVSPAMINIARTSAAAQPWGSRATYVVQDVSALDLTGQTPFDLILCLYDSVNHLDGIESVAVMARAAAEAARPGALLVVDLNTALAFVGWAGTDEVIDDEFGRLAGRGSYDAETGEASLHLEGYLLDETGEKRWFAETETERLLDPAALLAALTRAGWGSHRLTTYADLTAEVTAPDEAQRLVVVSLRASEHDP